MIKPLITFLLFMLPGHIMAQEGRLYIASQSQVEFVSDAPLELIEATNEQVLGALNIDDRSFAFRVPSRDFQGFNTSLQKTHFNDEFMESELYPYSSFNGKIIEEVDLSVPGRYTVRAKGKLNIHGLEHDRIIRCKLNVTESTIAATAEFTVFLDDHNIKIPSILNQKIAEEIKVILNISLKRK